MSEPAQQLPRTDSSLASCYDGLVRDLEYRDFSPKTIRTYSWALSDLFAFLRAQGVDDLADVKREHLERWQYQLLDRRLKPHSRQSASTAARKLLNWAAERDIVDWRLERALVSVRIKRQKRRRPIPKPDLLKILAWVWWEKPFMSLIDRRDRALFIYLLVSGLRVSEVIQLRRKDFVAPIVIQKGGTDKTAHTTPSALDLVQRYLAARRDESPWLWIKHGNNINAAGARLEDSGVREMCIRIALDLQLAKFSPHRIRHTSASYMANKGTSPAIVAAWMGHANIDTIYEYIEIDDATLLQVSATMEQLVARPIPRSLPPASRSWRDYRK